MGILRVKQRLNRMQAQQKIQRIVHLFTTMIRGVVFFVDRGIHKVLSYILRKLYRIKFLRPVIKKIHRFALAHHRFTSLAVVAVLMLTITAPVIQIIANNRQYALSSQARTLLGESNNNLSKKITYDEQARLYQFNKDAKKDPATEGNPMAKLQSQVGGAGEEDRQQHSIDIPKNLSKGITYYDNQMGLSFKLVPEFTTKQGGLREGHLIYPLREKKGQVAYTVTNSGLKENIILYKSPGDTFKTSYLLDLPKSLEAKLIPETGEIGIYSADPTLFGNISYGSSDDQTRVENARNNAKKNYLTFKIPAPIVMGLNGNDQSTVAPVKSSFSLQDNVLTVTTTGLEKADYPLAIDPSVSVDSTSDFQTGNQEDNNSTVESGSIKRSALSGGTVGSWTNNATNMSSSDYYHSSVAYNGYLYNVAGSSVKYAPISSDGSIGSWTPTASISGGGYNTGVVAYNGYLYALGGGTTPTTGARYAPISSDGSIGSWTPTTSLATGRTGHQAVAYNGYMYVIGGLDGATSPSTQAFNYTGAQQTYTVPAGVTSIDVDVRGARGQTTTVAGGNGGRVQATMNVTPGQTLYIYVGGLGLSNLGSFNGGGIGYNSGSGGGASDIRQGGTALGDRVVVAGGGGGGGANGIPQVGGAGGGLTGADGGVAGNHPSGWGGTPSAGGAGGTSAATCLNGNGAAGVLGIGGNGFSGSYGGGGGGGYYGGGGGTCTVSGGQVFVGGGGGGSSYTAAGVTGVTHTQGYQTGAGQVLITAQVPTLTNDVQYAPINADGTLGSWTSASTPSSFTNARSKHQSLAYNGYMYVIGGGGAGGAMYSDVQYARINADGTLGSWATTSSFATAREYHSAVVSRGHIYILGGNTSNLNDVQYAPINTDGTLGAWNTTTTFNTGRYGHTSVAYNGYIYVIGGTGGVSVGDKIQYAKIDDPGTIGSYRGLNSFGAGRTESGVVAYNGYLYVISGWTSSGTPADTLYARIKADGTLDSWGITSSLVGGSGRHGLAAVVHNNMIYIIGGTSNSTNNWRNDVQRATVNADGTLSAWANFTNLPVGRYGHTASVYNGKIYVTGGAVNGSTQTNTVYIGTFGPADSYITWTTGPPLLTEVRYASSAIYNRRLYVVGGYGASNVLQSTIAYATIAEDGTLGSWNTTSLPEARGNHSVIISRGFMYVIGGLKGAGATHSTDTIRTSINSTTGALGGWSTLSSFSTAREGARAVEYSGQILVVGGRNAGAFHGDVQTVQINNGGSGATRAWVNGGTSFVNARYNHATVAYKGYLYIIGGFNGPSTYYADVQKAPILDNGGLGAWVSGGPSLPTARSGVAAVAHNGYMYVLGGKNASGFLNEVQRASIDSVTGTLGVWSPDTSFAAARYAPAAVTYNGYMYILGGNDAGPQTTVFDYTGAQQTYTVPAGVTSVRISAQGADGGGSGLYYDVGGSGAYAEADLSVTPGETLYVQVGGNGSTNSGYNGGGNTTGDLGLGYSFIGGGASDVRQGGAALANRKIVAAGGGGAGGGNYYGAYGGGGGDASYASPGGNSSSGVCTGGGGATSSVGGAAGTVQSIGDTEKPGQPGVLGSGGAGGDVIGGGGGGGYYGGGGGGGWQAYAGCGGGGGSSYVGPGTSNSYIYAGGDGYGYGQDGQVAITYGKSAYNDVYVAKINNNGTLGSWTATANMTQDRTLHAAAVAGGYIYAAGGTNNISGVVYRTVEYAPINSDGTVGAWSRTATMSSLRLDVSLAVVNGYMYAIGGHSGATALNSVEYAPINSSGTLGNWQATENMGSARSSEGKSATSYNGRLYITGGHSGSAALNTTEYAALQSIPRRFSYSKVIDLGTTSNITGLSFTGNSLVSRDNLILKYKVGNSSGVFGAYKSSGSFSCSEGDAGRYAQIFLTLDDENIASFKDADGLRSVLDSVKVDSVPFAAPSEKRLRHGAFFQNQTLQPFNTNNTQCSV